MDDLPTEDLSNRLKTAVLVLADGSVYHGEGIGATGEAVGEICFNTAMTGYQEILTDPSYAGQIITFTFPHIGNVGTNREDMESATPAARGFVVREPVPAPSNWRSEHSLEDWAKDQGLIGISGVDTRRLTRHIRAHGAPNGVIAHDRAGQFDLPALVEKARTWPGLHGMELARDVSTSTPYPWQETLWQREGGYGRLDQARAHIVAVDFGIKRNILRNLASAGARVTVVPAETSFTEIMALAPDAVFLSNGPGDPAATAGYALPMIKDLIASGLPVFGICLGHQILGLALGGRTVKMQQGHRGANHPVKDIESGRVSITAMNHGFAVAKDNLAEQGVAITQLSLFDGTICALKAKDGRIFSVQQHPEASPGPQDNFDLFSRFVDQAASASQT
ncbi:carbamoyl-phosphate synthase small chain [Iodidimonas nitroreducens]|uniref:Carbamoyl phosphate synthase small chain n=1 Tax=Iodidimonas nitroreducens TaxID=1236968 RepID=A0A5A7N8L3_9PROT|nr:glutamine-hydrolyzing carbamoyl-phosphate synthase small subunit [Iodidimonas nitroreducens]GAK33721.1 carbamoyl-phosphate synthase small chain [alpha proteobacterium Q-1]GER03965.1 carbamoyl-phosphate synthase small chain [Iodidimonas nitroreducens]